MKFRITPLLWYSFTLHLLAAAILVQCGFLPLSPLRIGDTPIESADTVMIELHTLERKKSTVSELRTMIHGRVLSPRGPSPGHSSLSTITGGRLSRADAPGRPGDRPTVPPVLTYSASTEKTTDLHSAILHQILRQIARARHYPQAARAQHLEGRPVVQFRIARNGQIASATVIKTSGHALLDTAAIDTIRRAAPLPYYAEAIQLPVRFELR